MFGVTSAIILILLSAVISPPWAFIILYDIERPKPVPFAFVV